MAAVWNQYPIHRNLIGDMQYNASFRSAGNNRPLIYSPPLPDPQARHLHRFGLRRGGGGVNNGCFSPAPVCQQNVACLLGCARFSRNGREKPKLGAGLTGSDSVSETPNRVLWITKISKWMLVTWMAISWTAFIIRCQAVRAVEIVPAVAPPLSVKIRALLGSIGPKIVQVLSVFRDHGLIITALLGLSAFFSMAETSIMTLWPWKVRELAEKEPEDGVFRMLRQDVTRFLTTILIGTTVANIAATALVTEAATTLFGEAGISAATGVMTVIILLLTEITPKSIAVHNATEVARFVVRPVAWLSLGLYPVGRVVTALSMGMLKTLGLKSRSEPFVTEEELKLMLRGAELSGAIEEEEQDMIENVLEIKDTYVREVMTPLVDVVAIDAGATLMDFRNLWVSQQYSRVPVFERRIDNIVGIAYAMDMLDYVEQAELLEKLTVGRIVHKPAYFVPDSMSVWNLLREFRIRKVHMAIVLNEYGGTIGIVTLEDVVEEIVGEIFDEHDSKEEIRKKTGYVVQRASGVFDVDANTSIEDLAEALEVKLAEGPYHFETVSGFVCEAFGYIPRTGESINIVLQKADDDDDTDFRETDADHQGEHREKYQKYKLEILAGNARKVNSVRFEQIDGEDNKDTVTHVFPRIVKRRWENGYDTDDHKDRSNEERTAEDKFSSTILSQERESCEVPQAGTTNRYLIAESVNIDCGSETRAVDTPELTVIDPRDWDVDMLEDIGSCTVQPNDIDVTPTAVSTLNEKWKPPEKPLEKRKRRRRKQPADATPDLEDEQGIDLGYRDAK